MLGQLAGTFNTMLEALSSTTVSRRFVDQILDSMHEMLLVVDEEGEIVRANATFKMRVGVLDDDLRGKHLSHFVAVPLSRTGTGAPQTAIRRTLATAREEELHVSVSVAPLEYGYEPRRGFVVVIQDSSETMRHERKLRASEQRFHDFTDVAADWYWETDADLRVHFVSQSFTLRTGLDIAQVLGRTHAELTLSQCDEAERSNHLEQLRQRQPFHGFGFAMSTRSGRCMVMSERYAGSRY